MMMTKNGSESRVDPKLWAHIGTLGEYGKGYQNHFKPTANKRKFKLTKLC